VVDKFSIIFWSIAAGSWTLLCAGVAWHDSHADEESRVLATEFVIPVAKLSGDEEGGRLVSGHLLHSPVSGESGRRRGGGVGRTASSDDATGGESTGSAALGMFSQLVRRQVTLDSNADLEVRQVCMPRNLWAFLVVVALGQAKVHRHDFPRAAAFLITMMSSFVQLAAVSLLVYDIDPKASPWTTDPDARWKTSGMSVNYMKGVQIVFLIAALVPEVGQSLSVFQAVFLVRDRTHELRIPSAVLIAMGFLQYCITMWTLFGGVSVVLSFQNTPDIIYSSMAITFISAADDTFYLFFEQIADIDANFTVTETVESAALEWPPEQRRGKMRLHHKDLPYWSIMAMKTMSVFPLVWAVFLLSRAWYTNIMPSERVRTIFKYSHSMLRTLGLHP